mgnify:CR=1 FL=1
MKINTFIQTAETTTVFLSDNLQELQQPDFEGNTLLHSTSITACTISKLGVLKNADIVFLLQIKNHQGLSPIHHQYIDMSKKATPLLAFLAGRLTPFELATVFQDYFYKGNKGQCEPPETVLNDPWRDFTSLLKWSPFTVQSFVFKEINNYLDRFYDFRWFTRNPLVFRMVTPNSLHDCVPDADIFFAARDQEYKTPLHYEDTIEIYYPYAWQKLKRAVEAFSQQDKEGNTPLHNPKIARVLLPLIAYQIQGSVMGWGFRHKILALFQIPNKKGEKLWQIYWDETFKKLLEYYPFTLLFHMIRGDFPEDKKPLPDTGLVDVIIDKLKSGVSSTEQRKWIATIRTASGQEPFKEVVKMLKTPMEKLKGENLVTMLYSELPTYPNWQFYLNTLLLRFESGELAEVTTSQWVEVLTQCDEKGATPFTHFAIGPYTVDSCVVDKLLGLLSVEELLTVFNASTYRGRENYLQSFIPQLSKKIDPDNLYELLLKAAPCELPIQPEWQVVRGYKKWPHTLLSEILTPDQLKALTNSRET